MDTHLNQNRALHAINTLSHLEKESPPQDAKLTLIETVFSLFEKERFIPLEAQVPPTDLLSKILHACFVLTNMSNKEFTDQVVEAVLFFEEKNQITTGPSKNQERVRNLVFQMVTEIQHFFRQEIQNTKTPWDQERLVDVAGLAVLIYLYLE